MAHPVVMTAGHPAAMLGVEAAEESARTSGLRRTGPADPDLPRLIAIRDLARARDVSASALAIGWLLAHPAVAATVVAPRASAEWDFVHEALASPLADDEVDRLSALP